MRYLSFAVFVYAFAPTIALSEDPILKPTQSRELFTSGTHGYHTFRIPAIIATKKGTLLAFCEGRKNSRSDTGDIDLVYRRSVDGGKTWSKLKVLWDDGPNTAGNPCPVVDQSNGRIWLPMTWNNGKDPQRKIQNKTSIDTRRVYHHVLRRRRRNLGETERDYQVREEARLDVVRHGTGQRHSDSTREIQRPTGDSLRPQRRRRREKPPPVALPVQRRSRQALEDQRIARRQHQRMRRRRAKRRPIDAQHAELSRERIAGRSHIRKTAGIRGRR